MHTLRAAPCSGHAALQNFDDLLRERVCTITNTDLTDVQRMQARLAIIRWTSVRSVLVMVQTHSVRNGGLGVCHVSSLALSVFLASTAGPRDLQDMILSSVMLQDSTFDNVLVQWTTAHGQSDALPPVD